MQVFFLILFFVLLSGNRIEDQFSSDKKNSGEHGLYLDTETDFSIAEDVAGDNNTNDFDALPTCNHNHVAYEENSSLKSGIRSEQRNISQLVQRLLKIHQIDLPPPYIA
jgi:hypothetical protein